MINGIHIFVVWWYLIILVQFKTRPRESIEVSYGWVSLRNIYDAIDDVIAIT